jgi:hypothetical protein
MPDFLEQHKRLNRTLIEFLISELDLGFTLASIAQVDKTSNVDHFNAALSKARRAIETIRHFEGRVEDAQALHSIQERTDQLEKIISQLES